MGFGFVSPDWKPRSDLVGTYDDAWERSRSPLLPLDFDRRFFNSAPPELVAPGFLRGDEAVTVVGASPEGRTDFALPGIDPPRCRLRLRSRPDVDLVTALDTVVVDLDERELVLIWRAQAAICEEPLDVEAIRVTSTNAPTAAEHENPSNVVPLFAAATG